MEPIKSSLGSRWADVLLLLLLLLPGWLGSVADADLRSDLRDFYQLIPRRRIGSLAARHLVFDEHFRLSSDFIRSSEFPVVWSQIREADKVMELIDFLTQATSAKYDIAGVVDALPTRLRFYKIPTRVPLSSMMDRNLSTFLKDVVRVLPRARITNMLQRKVREGGDFAQLYRAAKSKEFRELLDQARESDSLAAPLQQLASHSINVDDVIEMVYTVLNWGP